MEMCREDGGRVSSHSQALNLDLWWTDGDLRCREPVAGNLFLRREGERAGRLAAESRAEAAESRLVELEIVLRRLRGGLGPARLMVCGHWLNATPGLSPSRVPQGSPQARIPLCTVLDILPQNVHFHMPVPTWALPFNRTA